MARHVLLFLRLVIPPAPGSSVVPIAIKSVLEFQETGAPEEIRTPNLLIRSQMLYPIELRALMGGPRRIGLPLLRRGPSGRSRGGGTYRNTPGMASLIPRPDPLAK